MYMASQVALVVKNLLANAGDIKDMGLIPGSGRSPGGGHGNPLQCSCLENPRDGGAWWAAVYGVAQSRTQLKRLSSSSSSSSSSRMPLEVTYEGEVISKMHSIFLKCKHKTEEASQLSLVAKNLPGNAGDIKDMGLIPGLGRSPGGESGNPLQ